MKLWVFDSLKYNGKNLQALSVLNYVLLLLGFSMTIFFRLPSALVTSIDMSSLTLGMSLTLTISIFWVK